jgi:pimeloyl-ACP methyl ester carboxylesterase
VAGQLRAAGHEVHPVTLTGVAERAAEASPEVDLDTHTEELVRFIANRDLREVVLVAHSYGGFPVTAAAQRLPGRIAQVIYVDSGPVPDGVSQFGMQPPEEQRRLGALVAGGLLPPPAWDPATEPYLDGLDAAALALLRERSTPHPFGSMTQPIRRTGPLGTPLALVSCLFPVDQVRKMIEAGHPFFTELAGARLRELPTGHWPMFSEPERLAGLLAELAAS